MSIKGTLEFLGQEIPDAINGGAKVLDASITTPEPTPAPAPAPAPTAAPTQSATAMPVGGLQEAPNPVLWEPIMA